MFDILGYLATAVVVLSFSVKDVYRLRWINLLGCVLFTLYGVFTDAWPIIISNMIVAGMNIYHILLLVNKKLKEDPLF